MGFTPREVEEMSMWQFTAACAGFSKQNEDGMTDKEADALWGWMQTKDDVPLSFAKH